MSMDVQVLLGDDRAVKTAKIEELTRARLAVILGTDVPEELEYIVTEVSIKRFNRIGSEGLEHHSVEGETQIWSSANDFDDYADDIAAWKKAQEGATYGRLRFL